MFGKLLAGALLTAAAVQPAVAQELSLERIFAPASLEGPSLRLARLSPDGSQVAVLRGQAEDRSRFDLWLIDTRTGAERRLVDSTATGSGAEISEAEKMHRERLRIGGSKGITAYEWAPGGGSLLFMLDGDLFLVDLAGRIRRLTATAATEIDAHISAQGGFVSFVRDQKFVTLDLATGKERVLTEGGDTVTWGTAEFVAQEEMGRYTGHWWAPGDKWVAVQRTDESNVKIVTRAAIGASGTSVFRQRYPQAGTPNALVELWIMKPDGSARVKADLGIDADSYLARVDWDQAGGAVYVQRQDREQTVLDLLKVDPVTGHAEIVFSERAEPKTWINLSDDLRLLKGGSLIWWSERDGHGHLYRFQAGQWTQLTHGAWEVRDVIGVDEARGRIYFTGNRETPLERHAYALDYRRPGAEPVRLTEAGWMNNASMDKAATRLIVTRSSPDQPPQSYLADTTGKRLAWLSRNAIEPGHPYQPYLARHRPTRFGTIRAADGSPLHWEMITPELEPGKCYPVFFQHYGGPTAQQVTRSWSGALPQYWVSRGWIFFQIDNRGSANRGRAFEDQIWHHLGSVEVDDQIAGAEYLKSLPFVCKDQVATYGWSYGGFMTLKMLEQAPGVFAAGVSGAPVTRWGIYDTHATERYLGNPAKDPRPYALTDPLPYAASIRDPLLMLHGMSDDNVVFEQATAFYAALQQAGIPFEMMVYPGMTHHISGQGPQAQMWRTIENFLDRHVKDAKPAK